jgi:hypothetical protein
MSLIYSAGFIYVFSALGNVGLLARERTLLFPVLFVLFALPTAAVTRRTPDASSAGAARDWRVPAILRSDHAPAEQPIL